MIYEYDINKDVIEGKKSRGIKEESDETVEDLTLVTRMVMQENNGDEKREKKGKKEKKRW